MGDATTLSPDENNKRTERDRAPSSRALLERFRLRSHAATPSKPAASDETGDLPMAQAPELEHGSAEWIDDIS